MSNADRPLAGQPQPGGSERREWSATRIAIVAAIVGAVITGVFTVIAAVAPTFLPWHQEPGSSSTPTATSTHSSPPAKRPPSSPGVPIPVSPAFRLYDPGSTGVYGVAFTRSGMLAAGDLNGSAYLWDVAENKVAGTFPDGNGEGIFGVALSPDGTILAASTLKAHGPHKYQKGSVVLWNTSSGKLIATLNAPDGRGFGNPPAFSPDGSTLAAANADGRIYLWNTATGKPAGRPLTDPGSQVDFGIAFSPATGFLAAADGNGTTFLWNTRQESIVRTFQDPDSQGVNGVAFSPGGSTLATGDNNGNVYLWNVATGARLATLHGPKGGIVSSIAFSPLGGILAATSDNDTDRKYVTCIWDTTGKRLATFHDPQSLGVTRIAFSPDGSILAVGDENANTYIWNMNWHSS